MSFLQIAKGYFKEEKTSVYYKHLVASMLKGDFWQSEGSNLQYTTDGSNDIAL